MQNTVLEDDRDYITIRSDHRSNLSMGAPREIDLGAVTTWQGNVRIVLGFPGEPGESITLTRASVLALAKWLMNAANSSEAIRRGPRFPWPGYVSGDGA